MADKRDYYEILGVTKTTAIEKIKEAFVVLCIRYPDKKMELREAYKVLSNEKEKAIYDRSDSRDAYDNLKKSGINIATSFDNIVPGNHSYREADFALFFGVNTTSPSQSGNSIVVTPSLKDAANKVSGDLRMVGRVSPTTASLEALLKDLEILKKEANVALEKARNANNDKKF